MYTKFTRYLDIRANPGCKIQKASVLVSYAKGFVLLRCLQRLSVRSLTYSEHQFDWVTALFYDSLLEISVIPNLDVPSPLSLSTVALWLDTVAIKYPKLYSLSIYPYSEWVAWDEYLPASVSQVKDKFWKESHVPMAKLTQLRRLSISMYLTERETLTAIANLPNLEHLEIGITHQNDTLIMMPSPADGLFHKLKHLALHYISRQNIFSALSTSYLMGNLTSLDLVVHPKPIFEEDWVDNVNMWIWEELGKTLRQTTHLQICFDLIAGDQPSSMILDEDIAQVAHLPLEHFLVRKALLDEDVIEGYPCEPLTGTSPNFRHLHWPDQPVKMTDLFYFASLPHLCHLTINLNIRPVEDRAPSPELSGSETFRILECSKVRCGEGFELAQVVEIAK